MLPVPLLGSVSEPTQPSTFACTRISCTPCHKANNSRSYLSGDELKILSTLRIAIPSAVFSACIVAGVLRQSTIRVHLDKVQRAVNTARQIGDIDIESEL